MKLQRAFSPVLLAMVMLMLAADTVLAQGGSELPRTASDGVVAFLTAVGAVLAGGTLGNALTEVVKSIPLPFLGPDEDIRLGGLLAETAALLISSACGWFALQYLTPLAQWLDDSGLWAVAVAAYPVARGWYEVRTRRKAREFTNVQYYN